ncbi:MAG: 16S rRNA (cytosine(1402)-N(4))-methyltransferase RsmH [Patescibacteria group bacterium]|nr:16S rRNA (cytosine(1402)-N(4))-methyltransferase RsmH [Patescibacteria group bacterium]
MTGSSRHQPVLLIEVVAGLDAAPGKHFIDGTAGGGGHAKAILEATAPDGRLLGIDLDPAALSRTQESLSAPEFRGRFTYVHGNFKNIATIARQHQFVPTGGCLFDLGVSSPQLDDPAAGFSFRSDRLDFRFDPENNGLTAAEIVNRRPVHELERMLREFGEEPLARPIAIAIDRERRRNPIERADALAALVARVYARYFRSRSRRHPATRVFQALRVAVNGELDNLQAGITGALEVMPAGARIAVMSYQSLEDRIVKHFFKNASRECRCPPDLPECRCQQQPTLRVLTPKPIRPNPREVVQNPRSRSAKLRIAERLNSSVAVSNIKPTS